MEYIITIFIRDTWLPIQKQIIIFKKLDVAKSNSLHVVASAPAADATMPRLVIDSIKPPYTILFKISHFLEFSGPEIVGAGGAETEVTCVVEEAIGLSDPAIITASCHFLQINNNLIS